MISRETFNRWQKEVEEHLNLSIGCDTGCKPSISGIMHFESKFGTLRPRQVLLEEIDYVIVDEVNVKKVEKFALKKFRRTKNL